MRLRYYILIIFPILSGLFGCTPTRHLKEDQYILFKQSIKGNKEIPSESLVSLYKQKTNRKFLGLLPYVSIYNFGKKHFDTSKVREEINRTRKKYDTLIVAEKDSVKAYKLKSKRDSKLEKLNVKYTEGNWIMRAPGEAPSIFDSSLMNKTVEQMQFYLHSKGFFQGKAFAELDTTKKKIKVIYHIKEGPSYKVKNVTYNIKDPVMDQIVQNNMAESTLKANESYDEGKISAERERLNKLMKNNGYYDFTRQFILFEVDTTEESQKANIYVIIEKPADGSLHKQYTINKIYFNTDVINIPGKERDTAFYRGKYYVYYKHNFSKKILNYKTKINSGELYNQSKLQESQIQLASLDMYKFININFEKTENDSTSNTLNAFIRTSPFKKYQISDEWGVNVGQGFIPGPFGSITFKERNVFRGFEIFEASIRYSLEAVLAQSSTEGEESDPIIMKEYGGTVSLTFPQIFFPEFGRKARNYSPRTKVILGYNFVDRPEYVRSILRTALNYNWQRTVNKRYDISLIDINIVNTTRLDSAFNRRLIELEEGGNNLRTSFKPSIVTSFNLSYTYNNQQFGIVKKSKYWKPYFEIGGNIVNAASKYITQEADNKFLGLQYYEFIKVSSDLRYYFPVKGKNTIALRFNMGFARPYGSSDKNDVFVLPYEKYFFAGGSSSIRAWKPRRLGPGGYKDPRGYIYEQPGEILLESNFEYRSNLFSFVDWAFFVDAGNVWKIKEDETTPDAEFKLNTFPAQIAVGSGLGLRFDFTFLILRFDLGIKVWDPGEKGDDRLALIKKPPFTKGSQPVLNIGIGYPF